MPTAFGTAVTYLVKADPSEEPAESNVEKSYTKVYNFGRLGVSILTDISAGSTRSRILNTAPPGYQTIYEFTTADVASVTRNFSLFPVTNTLVIGWDADVDFIIEFDFTVLPIMMNMRSEVMDLLEGRRTVEDPNISNVDGKRSLVRAGLRVPEE